ncbi:unnamed protein product [Brassica napus]|nr:unnamed protein product [Brassica napus]
MLAHRSACWPFPCTVRVLIRIPALPPTDLAQRPCLWGEAPTEGRQPGGGRMRRF